MKKKLQQYEGGGAASLKARLTFLDKEEITQQITQLYF
jgi:hypothetical protein